MEPITKAHIESRPDKCGGSPCVAGTRIRVQDIYVWHAMEGRTPIEIIGEYPELSLANVHAAIAYAFDNREAVEAEIAEENSQFEALKAASVSKIKQKLDTKDGNTDQVPS